MQSTLDRSYQPCLAYFNKYSSIATIETVNKIIANSKQQRCSRVSLSASIIVKWALTIVGLLLLLDLLIERWKLVIDPGHVRLAMHGTRKSEESWHGSKVTTRRAASFIHHHYDTRGASATGSSHCRLKKWSSWQGSCNITHRNLPISRCTGSDPLFAAHNSLDCS